MIQLVYFFGINWKVLHKIIFIITSHFLIWFVCSKCFYIPHNPVSLIEVYLPPQQLNYSKLGVVIKALENQVIEFVIVNKKKFTSLVNNPATQKFWRISEESWVFFIKFLILFSYFLIIICYVLSLIQRQKKFLG